MQIKLTGVQFQLMFLEEREPQLWFVLPQYRINGQLGYRIGRTYINSVRSGMLAVFISDAFEGTGAGRMVAHGNVRAKLLSMALWYLRSEAVRMRVAGCCYVIPANSRLNEMERLL